MLCPLKATVGENIGYDCWGNDCAWFYENDCAVLILALAVRLTSVPADSPELAATDGSDTTPAAAEQSR